MNTSIRFIAVSLFILGTAIATAQTSGPLGVVAGQSGWSGTYSGNISGTTSKLTIRMKGDQSEGEIDASGYMYSLSGQLRQGQMEGMITDNSTGGSMNFAATLNGNRMIVDLIVQDAWGQTSQVPVEFMRLENPSSAGSTAGNQTAGTDQHQHGVSPGSNPYQPSGPGGTGAGNVERDHRLVGGWRYSSSYTSDDFSMVSEWYMTINADGTYRYGDGKIAGGDGGSSFGSGGGDFSTGQWKTTNSVVYINEGYGWQPYASYYLEGNSMLFKFENGEKQLWHRYR